MKLKRHFCFRCIIIGISFGGFLLWTSQGFSQDFLDSEVETLSLIEVPGTIVIQERRKFPLLQTDITSIVPLTDNEIPQYHITKRDTPAFERTIHLRDPIADSLGVLTPVSPMKAERPPYPMIAREQGWKGTVILRLEILPDGTVGTISTKQTSGHPVLDDNALQTVKQWRFKPAKDGEFSIRTIVDLPIKFDLNR